MNLTEPPHNSLSHLEPRAPGQAFNGVGIAPATFGELIQGREAGSGDDFLVTLPITAHSTVKFCGFPNSPNLYVYPRHKKKSLAAARLFLEKYGIRSGGIVQVENKVEEGKGLASSSADVVATLRALADYYDLKLQPIDLSDIIRKIEPTDGVMYDEVVSFFHRKVELKSVIGRLPRLAILAVDEGGMIDTVSYNKQRFEFSDAEMKAYSELLAAITTAICERDVRRIGRLATASARMHQARNHKLSLERLEALMEELGADGVVNCHSGTLIGLCFALAPADALERVALAQARMEMEFNCCVQRFFSK